MCVHRRKVLLALHKDLFLRLYTAACRQYVVPIPLSLCRLHGLHLLPDCVTDETDDRREHWGSRPTRRRSKEGISQSSSIKYSTPGMGK